MSPANPSSSTSTSFIIEDVILVDENNTVIGRAPKLKAHMHGGMLHRAFSVVTIDSHQRVLVQRRAAVKVTFPGLLSNTCCSHPLAEIPGDAEGIEGVKRAACRRYAFELGIPVTQSGSSLMCIGIFRYKATSPAALRLQTNSRVDYVDLCESEMDYVLLDIADDVQVERIDRIIETVGYNKDEISELLWLDAHGIHERWAEMTPWFQILFSHFLEPLLQKSPAFDCVQVSDDTDIINFL